MAPPSFAFDLMRRAVLSLAVKHPQVRSLINPRQTEAITYVDSPLNWRRSARFAAGPRPGAVLPECPVTLVEDGKVTEAHLTDLVGPRFTAFYFTDDGTIPAELEAFERKLSQSQVPFKLIPLTQHLASDKRRLSGWDHTGRLFAMYGAESGSLYLVRPDGHVFARWREAASEQISDALNHALHRQ